MIYELLEKGKGFNWIIYDLTTWYCSHKERREMHDHVTVLICLAKQHIHGFFIRNMSVRNMRLKLG